ncbi:RING finger and SPRY domain-containing protein 1-like [Xenia sp. Carnegie-2017]|uniref:RING finger and SPRY domain-containing protein 1-like n=1 Tax=Xenia sp. Carnegie-2017 TaxID=2897299 RepID=UPI001F03E283|nr:RING finger and SPRY domain-containing protein 1-like [Xenia sp. Carnegie-2017]
MGCRISRRNNEISESRDTNAIKFLEEDISSSSKHAANVSTSPIQSLVLEVLNVVRMLTESLDEPPACLKELHEIAETESGWLEVVLACIEVICIENDLGPIVISILLEECSLVSVATLEKLLSVLDLSSKGRPDSEKSLILMTSSRRRNISLVLGSLADKLAGPQSVWLMKEDVLHFLQLQLTTDEHPSVVLFSIITLEKFAKTNENKEKIKTTNTPKYLAKIEKSWLNSDNVVEHQAGFCAQWCLDNCFPLKTRPYSYESSNLDGINAMLNANDVSACLKISPNGLEARSDASSFESVRSTCSVTSGTWFYEVTLLTSGVMQIGWATKESKFLSHEGFGIGDDPYSIAFDGCRQLIWFEADSSPVSCAKWKANDVLGFLLNIDENKVIFYLNGKGLERYFPAQDRGAFFAAASFMSFQHCKFNFGAKKFQYPPKISFNNFNDHSTLTDKEKIILPRHLLLAKLKNEQFHVDSCTICYENIANAVLLPCQHRTICFGCASKLEQCPICRGVIEKIAKQIVSTV